ncbi:MAG: hypothetical protein AAFY60_21570, partial [Myxococcota bacterium]
LEWGKGEVVDPPWSSTVGRLVRRTGAAVVPIYFDGINGMLFHIAGLMHPLLRTALIPREMIKRQGSELRVRIGHPVSGLSTVKSDEEIVARAREATFALARESRHGRTYNWRDVFSRASRNRRVNDLMNT